LVVFGVAVALLLSLASIGQAQSLVAGDISGVIADPSSAIISGATVTLTSLDTGRLNPAPAVLMELIASTC